VVGRGCARDVLIQRLSGRRTCLQCGASFHVVNRPPKVEGICDQCGSALVQRPDDQPAAIEVRLAAYENNTRPLIDFYQATGRLVSVPASAAPEAVALQSVKLLSAHLN
jgi:adenylate kinase